MQRRSFAVLAVGVGLLIGALATLFFYGKQFGLSVPVFVLICSAALIGLSKPAGRSVNRRNVWLLLPILFFAVMIAVRDDWMIIWLNFAAIMALGSLLLHYLTLQRPLDTESLAQQTGSLIQTGFMVLPYAAIESGQAWAGLREVRHDRGRQATSVVRGLVFAAPVILVFAVLLGSADAVFAGYVNGAFDGIRRMLGIQFMSDGIAQIGVTLIIGTVMTGAIGYSLTRRLPEVPALVDSDGDPLPATQIDEKRKPGFKLSMIESGIVLGSVALLFAAFVVVQFAYFFGGESNVGIQGLTYAQYARRGFFELVAVSTMTLGLALFLDRVTMRHDGRENTIFRMLSVLLAGLTTVLVTSAAQRMWLYEEAYGFTQLRVYTHVAIVWLGVMLGVFVLALFRLRRNVFSLGTVLVLIGYLATLNLMNVDYYIAERNIARYQAGQELDIAFLNTLSADAVPVILPFFQQLDPDSEVRGWAEQWLSRQIYILDGEKASNGSTLFSWNLSQEMAIGLLNSARYPFPAYDPTQWYGYSSIWSTTDAEYEDYRDATAEYPIMTPVTR